MRPTGRVVWDRKGGSVSRANLRFTPISDWHSLVNAPHLQPSLMAGFPLSSAGRLHLKLIEGQRLSPLRVREASWAPVLSHCLRVAGRGARGAGPRRGAGAREGLRGGGWMLSLQGRRRRRPQRGEREPGGQQGGERAAGDRVGRLHRVLAARRRAALSSDGLSHALRAPGWAGRAAGREDPLHGPEERHVPGPLPTFPRNPHGGLRPQPTGEERCQAPANLGVGSGCPGKERVICYAWMRGGCLRDPHSRGLMIDALLA